MKNVCGLTSDEIFDLIEPSGFSRKHALAISNRIYKNGTKDFSGFRGISKILRIILKLKLASEFCLL